MEITFRLLDTIATNIFSQINIEELIRDMGEKEVMRLLKLLELYKVEKQKKIESKWKEITMKDRKKKSKEEVEED